MRGVIVLGMHRSGTSATTGMLHAAGLSAGAPSDLLPGDPGNESGYFERRSVVDFDDELLATAGGTWALPPSVEALSAAAQAARPPWLDLLSRLVDEAGGPISVKDPRMCLLPGLWREDPGDLYPLLTHRHPVEVSRSLVKAHRLRMPHAIALWELYTTQVLDALHGSTVYLAAFSEILASDQARRSLVTACLERCGVDGDVGAAVASVRAGLRHQVATEADRWLTGHQRGLHEYLEACGTGEVELDVPDRFRRVSEPAADIIEAARAEAATVQQVHEVQAALEQTRTDLGGHLERVAAAEQQALRRAEATQAELTEVRARLEAIQGLWVWRAGRRVAGRSARVRGILRERLGGGGPRS